MSKAKKSQFDTKFNYSVLVLLVAITPTASFAAPKCDLYFGQNFINKVMAPIKNLSSKLSLQPKSKIELSDQQVIELNEFINKDDFRRPYGVPRGLNPMFWYMWDMTPPNIKETLVQIIDSSPKNLRGVRENIKNIFQKYKIENEKQDSFFETVVSAWGDTFIYQENNSIAFSKWMADGYQKYLEDVRQNKISPAELRQSIEVGLQYRSANKFWDTQAGVNTLKIKRENNQDWVEIKDKWYKCQIDAADKSIKILVPRELVKRAAWNPLYTEVLTKKIASGAAPLKFYEGFLGANAYFYLTDGNHRFHIDIRPEVWVQISYPARSSSYRISFDAMGIRQPDIEDLYKFSQGQISLQDLIGPEAAKLFFFH